MKLRLATLSDRLRTMPMLKALIPFAAGIVLAAHVALPAWFVVTAMLLCGVAALLLQRRICLAAMLVAAGYGAALLHPTRLTVPLDRQLLFSVRITESGSDAGAVRRATGIIERWNDPATGRWYGVQAPVVLRCDSIVAPAAGERLLCCGRIRPIRGGSANYRQLMRSRGFVGSCRLTTAELLGRQPAVQHTFHQRAAERLQRLLPADPAHGAAAAVVRAMTIGDRSALPAGVRAAYGRSGMSHLLAVSGLHTGIVFLLTNLLLCWMSFVRRGHRIRNLLVIAAVWLFTAAAGYAPGTLRAALMCTLLQLACFGTSTHQALNAWALTALLLLAVRPIWLGDISFQLSFIAVAAILAWGLPLARRCRTGVRWLDRPLQVLIIGLVASTATAPLVSHAFGIVPLAGVLLNPLVVLSGTLIVAGGLLLLLAPLPGGWLLPATCQIAALQNRLAETVGSLGGAVVETGLTARSVAIIYLLFALATLLAWAVEPTPQLRLPK